MTAERGWEDMAKMIPEGSKAAYEGDGMFKQPCL